MSWFSDNYEKAALGGAALIAVALAALHFTGQDDVEASFKLNSPKHNQETGVSGLDKIIAVKKSLAIIHEIHQEDVDGRKVDLFTGVPLFSKIDDLDNPVDLLKSDPVHAGIPNAWWLKYGLDPGYADSPDRDPDKDGFTNREEFTAGTDPTEFKSHPDPILKLVAVSVNYRQLHIKPTDYGNGDSVFKLETPRGMTLNRMGDPIKAGNVIPFKNEFLKDRFKWLSSEKKQMPNGMDNTIWIIEDLAPNKQGRKYRFDKKGNLDGEKTRAFGKGIMDSVVELTLQALGEGGNPFVVDENTRFSLPFDAQSTQKPYLLKNVDLVNKSIEVEYTDKDGKKKSHVMKFKTLHRKIKKLR